MPEGFENNDVELAADDRRIFLIKEGGFFSKPFVNRENVGSGETIIENTKNIFGIEARQFSS